MGVALLEGVPSLEAGDDPAGFDAVGGLLHDRLVLAGLELVVGLRLDKGDAVAREGAEEFLADDLDALDDLLGGRLAGVLRQGQVEVVDHVHHDVHGG